MELLRPKQSVFIWQVTGHKGDLGWLQAGDEWVEYLFASVFRSSYRNWFKRLCYCSYNLHWSQPELHVWNVLTAEPEWKLVSALNLNGIVFSIQSRAASMEVNFYKGKKRENETQKFSLSQINLILLTVKVKCSELQKSDLAECIVKEGEFRPGEASSAALKVQHLLDTNWMTESIYEIFV